MGNICGGSRKKVRFADSEDYDEAGDNITDHSVGVLRNGEKVIVLREPLHHSPTIISSSSVTENSSRESSASIFSLGSKIVSQAKRNGRIDNRPTRPEFLGGDNEEFLNKKSIHWFAKRLKKGRFDDESEVVETRHLSVPRIKMPSTNGISPFQSVSPRSKHHRTSPRIHSANSSSTSSLHSSSTRSLKTLTLAMAPALPGTAEDIEDRERKTTTTTKSVSKVRKPLELRTAEVKRQMYPGHHLYKQFSHGNFKTDSSFFEQTIPSVN
ncbi:unnamed protein product [Dimorphilus gyrociliatus]|uniref:Uncharacterized protein n=1 Tax=Dimorphilus gyrociliatus TaxID=2664684 RepID=A0A7I8V922_9ANNE|nr:unnamed protein product [Dimorphilus gyrociliatus]